MNLPRVRLNYTLRTLFILLTLFCIWLGWNARIVQQRKQLRAEMGDRGWTFYGPAYLDPLFAKLGPRARIPNEPSWIRCMLGDEAVKFIAYPAIRRSDKAQRDKDERELTSAFPEAKFIEMTPQGEIMSVPAQ